MRLGVAMVGAMLGAVTMAAEASADCTCRAPGFIARHGETVCLKTPAGFRLARCEMSLNNSSWTILPDSCPQASHLTAQHLAAVTLASPTPPALR